MALIFFSNNFIDKLILFHPQLQYSRLNQTAYQALVNYLNLWKPMATRGEMKLLTLFLYCNLLFQHMVCL